MDKLPQINKINLNKSLNIIYVLVVAFQSRHMDTKAKYQSNGE